MEDPLRLSQSVELVAEKNSQAPTSAQSSYIQQWINYFENSSLTNGISPTLKEAAMNGKLRNCHFRSTCWQVCLMQRDFSIFIVIKVNFIIFLQLNYDKQ